MIYVRGDTHGDFMKVIDFCNFYNTSRDDVMIILGDAGINYFLDSRDRRLKQRLAELPITLFCIHGNHEKRPAEINTYHEISWNGGKVYVEDKYPNILFAKDAEIYTLNGLSTLVCGGAYSVDKYYRMAHGWSWWASEQPTPETKRRVLESLELSENKVDIILTHTCPEKYIPHEVFLPGVDQSTVDASTEAFLDTLEEAADYKKWYCGHYHTDKTVDKIEFLFNTIKEFGAGVDVL